MFTVNNSVVNLTKVLYDNYNGRSLQTFPSFGLFFELVYTKENLTDFLNVVYKELSELNGEEYSSLSSVDQLKNFAKSKGISMIFHNILGFLDSVPDDDTEFLEESLVELCLSRMRSKKRLVKNLVLNHKNHTLFDEYVMAKLNELKLTDLENTQVENGSNKKRQLNKSEFEESHLEELRKVTDELSKDYFSRWNAYLDRFYNLLDVFFKVKEFKDSKDFQVLMETLKVWRKNTEFRELNLDTTNVTKISSKTNKANRVSDLYNKTKSEFK